MILANVLHVLDMNKNLVSGDLLSKPGIKSIYKSGKLILSRNGIFVEKMFSCNGMIKLSVVLVKNNNNNVDFAYMVDSIFLWHKRLAHVGLSTIKRMVKCDMIKCDINEFKNCELWVKPKMTMKPFKSVERTSKLLEIVHYGICKLNGMLSRGGSMYFITFIDDFSRYTYVNLLT